MCATSCTGVVALARGRRAVRASLLVLVIAGCAQAKSPGGGGDGGTDGSDASPPDDADAGAPTGQVGDACERASQCRGDLVCEPGGACAEPYSCEAHGDCGNGAHCAGDGTCAVSVGGSPCAASTDCAYPAQCVGGFCGCRGESVEAKLKDVNMLVVLDRSSSMWESPDGEYGPDWEETKWYIAMQAIDDLMAATTDSVRFGLAVFPHIDAVNCGGCGEPGACRPGEVLVDIAAGAEGAITAALEDSLPDCCTPTGDTLGSLASGDLLGDPEADNYILLIADGMETCGGDAPAAAEALREREPPVRTFAVGFGGAVDPDELNAIAEAGATQRDGQTAYYQADDRDELERAFSDIAVEAFSCVHPVEGGRLDPERVHVYVDGNELERDPSHSEGWDYDADDHELSFHGAVCEALQRGEVDELSYLETCDLDLE